MLFSFPRLGKINQERLLSPIAFFWGKKLDRAVMINMEGLGSCIRTHGIQRLMAAGCTLQPGWGAQVLREVLGNIELLTWKHRCVCCDETPLFKLHWAKCFHFRAGRGGYGRGTPTGAFEWLRGSWNRQELSPGCSKGAWFEGADTQKIEVEGCSLELRASTGNPARAKWRGGNWQEIDQKATLETLANVTPFFFFFSQLKEIFFRSPKRRFVWNQWV